MVFYGVYADNAPYYKDYGPLNIHCRDFEETELADPNYLERVNALIRSVGRVVRRSATPIGKKWSKRRTIRHREEFSKSGLSGTGTESIYPRPQITQRNLDKSPFLALPRELRQQIYEEYYRSDAVKIQDLTYDGAYMLTHYKPISERWPPGRGPDTGVWNNLLGFPFTCRIIYPESIAYLYARCSFRFTDPNLALTIPRTFPTTSLRSIRSLDFAFFFHLLVHQFDMLDVRAHDMESNIRKLSSSKRRKSSTWLFLWSTVKSLPNLERVSLKVYQQSWAIQHHHLDNADQLLKLNHRLDHYILSPLFLFERGIGPEVVVDLCWKPEDAVYESLEERGFKVLVGGRYDKGYGQRG